jgi:hypothetical protein
MPHILNASSPRNPPQCSLSEGHDTAGGIIDHEFSQTLGTLVQRIAEVPDRAFRFWCVMTLGVNLHSLTPTRHAEEVVVDVIGAALRKGGPTDDAYRVIVDPSEALLGVGHDRDVFEPEEFEELVFAIVSLPSARARAIALSRFVVDQATGRSDRPLMLAVELMGELLAPWSPHAGAPA